MWPRNEFSPSFHWREPSSRTLDRRRRRRRRRLAIAAKRSGFLSLLFQRANESKGEQKHAAVGKGVNRGW